MPAGGEWRCFSPDVCAVAEVLTSTSGGLNSGTAVASPLVKTSPLIKPEANDILAALPQVERDLIIDSAEYIGLERRHLLVESEATVTHAWFLVDGIASILSVMADGTGVETATIGRDGMIGFQIFHDVEIAIEQTMMQVPGAAYRIPRARLRERCVTSPHSRRPST